MNDEFVFIHRLASHEKNILKPSRVVLYNLASTKWISKERCVLSHYLCSITS